LPPNSKSGRSEEGLVSADRCLEIGVLELDVKKIQFTGEGSGGTIVTQKKRFGWVKNFLHRNPGQQKKKQHAQGEKELSAHITKRETYSQARILGNGRKKKKGGITIRKMKRWAPPRTSQIT